MILIGGDLGTIHPLKCCIIEAIPPDGFDTSLFGFHFSMGEKGIAKWARGLIPVSNRRETTLGRSEVGNLRVRLKIWILGHTSFTDALSPGHSSLASPSDFRRLSSHLLRVSQISTKHHRSVDR